MIYTYDTITEEVVMVSEKSNEYTNKNWVDFEADEKMFLNWKTRENPDQKMYVRNGEIILE